MSATDTLGLAGTLAELEQERLATLKKGNQQATVIRIVTALAAVALCLTKHYFFGVFVLIAGLITAWIVRGILLHRVSVDFKKKVMPVLVKGVDPSLRYDCARFVPEADFIQAGFYQRPDRYSGKDMVEGNVGATAVRFSFIDAEERYEETDTDSDGHTHSHTEYRSFFRGLFFIADFNKHFAARTKVEPHGVNFLDKMFGSHVELESPEFNKLFAVSSTDQVEARYIMTPELMEHFMALRAKVGRFKASFVNEHVYLALEMPWNAFEPSLKVPLTQSEQVEKMVSRLKSITGIVAELDLNTRIWTKA